MEMDLVKLILGTGVGLLGWWSKRQDDRIAELEKSGSRVSVLEAHYVDIMNRLGRIEAKLDRLA